MLRGRKPGDEAEVRHQGDRQGHPAEEQGQAEGTCRPTQLLSEIKIHKTLHHKQIVEFYTVFEDQKNVYIILELCPNKTLSEMVKKRKKLTVKEARYYMHQVVSSLEYMHGNRVIHRDLKMGNIFLNDNMDLKVGDFGLATKLEFSDEKKRTMCGTPNYIAPEIV